MELKEKNPFYDRYKVAIIVFNLFFLVFLVILSSALEFLKFFQIIPISFILGLGFVTIFRDVLPIKNIFVFIAFSLFCELFFNTFIIFLLGILGFELSTVFFLVYSVIVGILSIACFLLLGDEKQISSYFKKLNLELVDIIWLVILIAFLFVFFKIGFERYFPNWDSFTYWAVDAKYIFEKQHFQDIGTFMYFPFYPLQLNYIYVLYGAVVEQFSGLLATFYAMISVFLIYGFIKESNKKFLTKSLLYLFLCVSLYSFQIILNLLTCQYAEVFCATVILFFGVILFNKEYEKKHYFKRISFLFLLSLSLFLTKTPYFPISFVLLVFNLLYDFPLIKVFVRDLLNNKRWLIVVICLICSLILYVFLNSSVFKSTITTLQGFSIREIFSETSFFYFVDLVKRLSFSYFYYFSLALMLFACIICCNKGISKTNFWRHALVLIIVILPVGLYMVKRPTLENGSLERYFSLVFFLLSFIFSTTLPNLEIKYKNQEKILSLLLIGLSILLLYKVWEENGLLLKVSPHDGKYQSSSQLAESYMVSKKVSESLPENAKVLIVGPLYKDVALTQVRYESVGDGHLPGLYLRYYLSEENPVPRPYKTTTKELGGYIDKYHITHLLLSKYAGNWSSCNDYLVVGKTYLVELLGKYDSKIDEELCPFISHKLTEIDIKSN